MPTTATTAAPCAARLAAAFEHWRDVREQDDAAAARSIAADALDVLVDLKGHTHGSRLGVLAHRPAPVQLHYLGFPGTLAYAGDRRLHRRRRHRAARLRGRVRRARAAAAGLLPGQRCAAAASRGVPARSTVGLRDDALVLACFNQSYKLTEPFFSAWLAALRAHPERCCGSRCRTCPRGATWRRGPRRPASIGGAHRVRADGAAGRARRAAALRRPGARRAAVRLAYDGQRRAVGRRAAAHLPRHDVRGPRGREPLPRGGAARPRDAIRCPSTRDLLDALCADPARLARYQRHLDEHRRELPLFDTPAFTRAFEALLEGAAG